MNHVSHLVSLKLLGGKRPPRPLSECRPLHKTTSISKWRRLEFTFEIILYERSHPSWESWAS